MSRVRVTIDRLSLRGFDAAQQKALVEGLKGELARLLADPAARAAAGGSRGTPAVRLGRMPLAPGLSGSRNFGARLARAITGRLGS
jgi:hypothetical protein